jgi:hypothetical protein
MAMDSFAAASALDQHDVRPLLHEHLLNCDQDRSGLFAMRPGPDVEIVLGVGQIQVLKEDPVHLIGIMLSGMDQNEIDIPTLASTYQRGHLHNLGPGAQHYGDLHFGGRYISP